MMEQEQAMMEQEQDEPAAVVILSVLSRHLSLVSHLILSNILRNVWRPKCWT